MKLRNKVLLAMLAAYAGATITLGPEKSLKDTKNFLENAYHETAGTIISNEANIGLENQPKDFDKYFSTDKEQDLFYKVSLPGKNLKVFKVELDDKLLARGRMEQGSNLSTLVVQTKNRTRKKNFTNRFSQLDLSYIGNFNTAKIKKGKHKLKLFAKYKGGKTLEDRAILRIR